MNNSVGYYNSRLIREYQNQPGGPLFAQVCVLVKVWAKCQNIVHQRRMSSYSLVLMVLHFFQQLGLLPNLQLESDKNEKRHTLRYHVIEGGSAGILPQSAQEYKANVWFETDSEKIAKPPKELLQKWSDQECLAELLEQFFEYYYTYLNLPPETRFRISVKRKPEEMQGKIPHNQLFSFQDPFDDGYDPGKRAYNSQQDEKQYIRDVFFFAYDHLKDVRKHVIVRPRG